MHFVPSKMDFLGERNVILAVDSSEHAERAVNFFLSELSRPGDVIHVLCIIEPRLYAAPSEGSNVIGRLEAELKQRQEAAQQMGERICKRLQNAGFAGNYLLRVGTEKPGVYICEVANDKDAQLIVMGSRGLSKIRRTFLGSVSDFVLHHAHRPVCVVPPPKAQS